MFCFTVCISHKKKKNWKFTLRLADFSWHAADKDGEMMADIFLY